MHLQLKLGGKLQSEGYDAFVCAFTTETMQLVGGQRLQDYTTVAVLLYRESMGECN